MAPIKRRAESSSLAPRSSKKPRVTASATTIPKAEPSFPRGGASILTPLEQKQIQIQANQDVLFEEKTGGQVARPDYDVEAQEQQSPVEEKAGKKAHKNKANSKRKVVHAGRPATEKKAKIEGLSYKRLVPGALVLGQVVAVNRHDVALALPNNLTGYVPLSSISDVLTSQLEEDVDTEDPEASVSENDEIPDITTFFHVGQYLRAYVVATEEESETTARRKRHISLSINPRQANAGLSQEDLIPRSMLQASVLSVEDHGLRMDLGMGDKIRGFLSDDDLGKDIVKATIKQGQTFLCMVTGKSAGGNTIQLSVDPAKIGGSKKIPFLKDGPTVDAFLPGTVVEFLVTENDGSGLAGKVMGMLDVTADIFHSAPVTHLANLSKLHPVGSKAKGRIISTFPSSDTKKLGVSLQSHVVQLASTAGDAVKDSGSSLIHPQSSVLKEATVVKVEPGLGIFLSTGTQETYGFAHISKLSDERVDELYETSGPYKLGTAHEARVLGYNPMDGLYILSLESKVVKQKYLFFDDIKEGDTVSGTIEKMIVTEHGVSGLIVKIADGISGLVPENHLSDVKLQHPERKFKEGGKVTARVLSVDASRRQLRLTLKKTLVNSESRPWTKYQDLSVGMQSPGTLIKILPNGAVVQFYGRVKGFLPVAEMSESFIQDPNDHFRQGQVVNVHILSVDISNERLLVSCKEPSSSGETQTIALETLKIGTVTEGFVREKSTDTLTLELNGGLKAILPIGQLVDGNPAKASAVSKRIRIDQKLNQLLVLDKNSNTRRVRLSSKASLLKAAEESRLPLHFRDVNVNVEVTGYIINITDKGVFVQFGGNLSALLPKNNLSEDVKMLPDYGFWKYKSVTAIVQSLNESEERFVLTLNKEQPGAIKASLPRQVEGVIDETITSAEQFEIGKLTKAQIVSVKDTQLNMQLADGVQGRIDVSSVFDKWQDIQDKKHPLRQFHPKQILSVRILGMHDSRNHRFLPISHRTKTPVFELTTKLSSDNSSNSPTFTMNDIQEGSSWIVFVNRVSDNALWVNLSPNVRGRVAASHVSDDLNVMTDLSGAFPIGSAIRAKVIKVDADNNRLDLSARKDVPSSSLTLKDLSIGQVLPARVTKITERQIMVHLSDHISGPLRLVDMADDYSNASPWNYSRDQIIRVCILDVDVPNKKLTLSNRPSRVLSSNSPVQDIDITSASEVSVNDVLRGFVKHIADNGVFIAVSSRMTAFVRITDLSDLYIKDWKAAFEVDQLVKGKVIAVDKASGHIQMSLKQSHIDNQYKAPLTFNDVYVGQVVSGKVRKVEDFGVFIVFDHSANVSGLCHKSQMGDGKRPDPRRLYEEGDEVKAKVLSIDQDKHRISLGVKASLFEDVTDSEHEDHEGQAESDLDDGDDEMNDLSDSEMNGLGGHAERLELEGMGDSSDSEDEGGISLPSQEPSYSSLQSSFKGLSTGGFDWTGTSTFSDHEDTITLDDDAQPASSKKKPKKKSKPFVDHTGDLDTNGPQSTSDFERLLLSNPSSSTLWLSYMAFHIQLSDTETARSIAQRALRSIPQRALDQKLNIWIGLLNLENTFGTPESLSAVFEDACTYNDVLDITQRVLSIFIQSRKYTEADTLFQRTLFEKKINQSPNLWLNYATFLFQEGAAPERGRALLPRAMQTLPPHTHVGLTTQFAKLEFETRGGDVERGRTVFEGLVGTWPKRLDLWGVMLEMEVKIVKKAVNAAASGGAAEGGANADGKAGDTPDVQEGRERVRRLFERLVGRKSKLGLRPRKARHFFKRWVEFEERYGAPRDVQRVTALATQYVREWEGRKEEEVRQGR